MIHAIRTTLRMLLSDKRGEDLAEVSSGISKGAKAVICLTVCAATAGGAAAMADSSNNAANEAAKRVNAPIGAAAPNAPAATAAYR
jgi:hypothetical protein